MYYQMCNLLNRLYFLLFVLLLFVVLLFVVLLFVLLLVHLEFFLL